MACFVITMQEDSHGKVVVDKFGLPLLLCLRGTNHPENVHRHMRATFGNWVTSAEMSHALLAEFRHRWAVVVWAVGYNLTRGV